MEFFIQNISSTIFIPSWISILIFFGNLFNILKSKKIILILTLLSSVWGTVSSAVLLLNAAFRPDYIFETSYNFISVKNVTFELGVYADLTASFMLLVVYFISLLVQIYSYSYMNKDESFARYYGLMNFFTFSMAGLVLSNNLFQTYIFWELVGVASYLLIGFWYKKRKPALAAKKAFIMNRIGDFSLLTGIISISVLLYNYAGSVDLVDIPYSKLDLISSLFATYTSEYVFNIICVLLLMGSIAKSAQFPLHTWLADAMEGPTPVSALIHSATMVAAGVYLVARLYPIYYQSLDVMNFILIIGLITSLMCAYFAITETDMKRILAYSTSSQLGIMFVAMGSGALTGGMIYLASHALIKSMLFLCAGAVMIAMGGSTDIRLMGGLRSKLPIISYSFLIGAFSLTGLLFCGFVAKNLVFHFLFETSNYVVLGLFLVISFMTAFYIFRMYFLIFENKNSIVECSNKLSPVLFSPIIILALCIVFVGFFFPNFKNNLINEIIPISIECLAVLLAFTFYFKKKALFKLPVLYNLSYNKFYIDEIYNIVFVKFYNCIAMIANYIDDYIFDGLVFVVVFVSKLVSWLNSKLQTGVIQSYLNYSLIILSFILTGFCIIYSLVAYFMEV